MAAGSGFCSGRGSRGGEGGGVPLEARCFRKGAKVSIVECEDVVVDMELPAMWLWGWFATFATEILTARPCGEARV